MMKMKKIRIRVKQLLAGVLVAALAVGCMPANGLAVEAAGHTHEYEWEVTKDAEEDAEGKLSHVCSCGATDGQTLQIPKTDIRVTMGKSVKIVSGSKKKIKENYKFTVKNASKYKKYFKIDASGKITTKNNFSTKVVPDIPVKVTVGGMEFNVDVHLELPMKIKVKEEGGKTRFSFTYNLKGAARIKVRTNPEIGNVKAFDTYVSGAASTKDSYVNLTNVKKTWASNYMVFDITVYHGKSGKYKSTFCVDPW